MHAFLSLHQLAVLCFSAHHGLPPNLLRAIGPVPELGFALQTLALGTAVGSAVALHGKLRDADFDPWPTTTLWATIGLAVGVVIAAIARLA